MSLLNADVNNVVNPYLTDVGVGLVFGLGYYLIKYIYGDNQPSSGKTGKQTQALWDSAKTIEEFNSMIKNHEEEAMNPFDLLNKISKVQLTPDINTYNNLLNACYINSNFESAEKLVEEIFAYGSPVQPDLSTYNILLKGLSCKLDKIVSNEEKVKIVSVMEKLLTDAATPNDVTINTCIDILVKAGEINKAWELFDSMKSKYDISPDKYSYSTIIKALRFESTPERLEKAFGILEYLRNRTSTNTNDEIIFNCLIDVCLKLNLIEKAEKVFTTMKEIGVTPSKITYAIMIKGYGQVYNLDKAFAMFEEMKANSVEVNEIVYGCLLNACVRCSDVKRTSLVYSEMKEKSLDMNIVLYTTLIKAYTKVKDLANAETVYAALLNDEKVEANIVAHNAMLDCCVECNSFDKMNKYYAQIKEKALNEESAPQPDLITYSTVIKGFARSKDMDKVFDLYNFLNGNNDFKMDEVIYNSVLDGCAKTDNFERALNVYNDMTKNQVKKSNVTYSILVKLYANNKMVEKALQLLEEMIQNNIKPGIIVYTCLIQTCLRNKKFEQALKLFEQLKKDGLKPDHVIYNTIVNGCLYNSRWELACNYTLESFSKGIRMAEDIYNNVLNKLTMHYCDLKPAMKCEFATRILKELKERNVNVDEDVYQRIAKMAYKTQGIKMSASSGNNSNQSNNSNQYRDSQNNYKRDNTKDQLKWSRNANK